LLLELLPERLIEISRSIEREGGECYLVGGWVRDALLGTPSVDFDIEVHRLAPEKLEQLLRRFGRVSSVGKSFGILLMRIEGHQIDFALPRSEKKTGAGHRNFSVTTEPEMGFEIASSRRDFTINSMGLRLPSMELCDPHSGLKDLEERRLRHIGPAFGEDPLRPLRGAQFAARFHLTIAPETLELCSQQDLSELSPERIDEEFRKLLLKPDTPSIGLLAIRQMELLRFFPELNLPEGEFNTLCKLCDGAARERVQLPSSAESLLLMYTALLLPLQAQKRISLVERLTRDRKIIEKAPALAAAGETLLQLEPLSKRTPLAQSERLPWVRRLSLAMSFPMAEALLKAQLFALEIPDEKGVALLHNLAEEAGVLEEPPRPWVQGRDLMQLGMKPSPQMGALVKELFEQQLDGCFSSPEEAMEWARKKIGK
jgi:tRNA nucleotidyltransferase (CCA-adding enzyme)